MHVGFDHCPYCNGTDTHYGELHECSSGAREIIHFVTQDVECENCGKEWTIEYLPNAYYLKGDETPRRFIKVVK